MKPMVPKFCPVRVHVFLISNLKILIFRYYVMNVFGKTYSENAKSEVVT